MKLRRYWGLGTRHFALLCRAFCTVVFYRFALFFVKYKNLARSVSVPAQGSAQNPHAHPAPSRPSAQAIAWSVKHTSRIVPFASCLTQALALQHLLGRYGEDSVIRIGVRTSEKGQIMAHAWVMLGDVILIGGPQSNIDRYVVMTDLKPG